THLVVCADLRGAPDVALGERRSLQELAELVAVALRPADVAPTLEDHELGGIAVLVEAIPMHDAAVDDQVVSLVEGEIPELRLESAASLRDVGNLVGLGVAVEVGVLFVRLHVEHPDILVEEERDTIHRGAAALLRLRSTEMPVLER